MRSMLGKQKYGNFILYIVVVILINIAGVTLLFRVDLTRGKIYSLSEASRDIVSKLSEPLTVKVFFTSDLPAPYNNIERYLRDLLLEFSVAGNRYFNYQFYNVTGEADERERENMELARNYGIRPVQIQKIEQDQVKFQKAFMGIALIHGDIIETIPAITSTEGLEFSITSTIKKMSSKISALLGLKDKINVRLFLSSSLQIVGPYINLPGLSDLPRQIERLVERMNEKNYGRLSFAHLDSSKSRTYEEEAEEYNVHSLQWKAFRDRRGQEIPADRGYAGIVVQYEGRTELIQLINVMRLPIFGTQYMLSEMEDLEKALDGTVENVLNINEEIGYLADHGTLPIERSHSTPGEIQTESLSNFHALLSKDYGVTKVNLKEEGIPEGLPSLIISGAREPFSDYELYQIDQYLMKGKNLAIFTDSFDEILPQRDQSGRMGGMQQPGYIPLKTGLEKLLSHYGISVKQSYVLDESSYSQEIPQAFGGGDRKIYFAPIIKNEFITKEADFMKNIRGLVVLKASPIQVDEEKMEKHGLRAVKLFSSSERAWEMSERINLNPMFINPPGDEKEFGQLALAYIVEGSFPSYFADRDIPEKEEELSETFDDSKSEEQKESGVDMSHVQSSDITVKKGKPGKIFLIGTSEVLKDNILDERGTSPNDQFIMNVLDYLNDREDYAVMRSKEQQFNPLRDVLPATRTFIKTLNIAGLPILVILAGVVVWFRRMSRKRMIQQMFTK
jgi:ABC-type uncharacterized transport system involved in gliding motility auxiliary subunit